MLSSRKNISENSFLMSEGKNLKKEMTRPQSFISNYEEAWDVKLARFGIKSINSIWQSEGSEKSLENASSTLTLIEEDRNVSPRSNPEGESDTAQSKSYNNSNDSPVKETLLKVNSNFPDNSSSDTISSKSFPTNPESSNDSFDEKEDESVNFRVIPPTIPPRLNSHQLSRKCTNSATQTDSTPIDKEFPKSVQVSYNRMNSEPMKQRNVSSTQTEMSRNRRHTTSENLSQTTCVQRPIRKSNASSRVTRKNSQCNPNFLIHDEDLSPIHDLPMLMSQSVIINSDNNFSRKYPNSIHNQMNTSHKLMLNSVEGAYSHDHSDERNGTRRRKSLRRAISHNENNLMKQSWMMTRADNLMEASFLDDDNDFSFNDTQEDMSYFGTCDLLRKNAYFDPTKFHPESFDDHFRDGVYPFEPDSRQRFKSNRRSESVTSKSSSKTMSKFSCSGDRILGSNSFLNLRNHLFGNKIEESLNKKVWFHPKMTRQESEVVLKNSPPGSYLVRKSETNKTGYSLSIKCSQDYLHMKIVMDKESGGYILGEFSKPYRTISEMIEHYNKNSLPIKGSSPVLLRYPCCSLKIT